MNEARVRVIHIVRYRLQGADLTHLTFVATTILLLAATQSCFPQTATVTINPEADAFVRAAAPFGNYGGAGAIAISGPTAVNGSNQPNGAFDSPMRFPMSNAVA